MSTPKHRTHSGTSYFVTTKCHQSRSIFQIPGIAEILVETLFRYRDQGAYLLHEFVVMPDHLHLILSPSETTSLEKAIGVIKGGSSHRVHKQRGHKMAIWQEGFFDWTIRDETDWYAKVEYIRMNPVRAKLVEKPEDWAYSSARQEFTLDPTPEKYAKLSSGAKAPIVSADSARGLKPPPPKEQSKSENPSTQRNEQSRPQREPFL